MNSPTDLDTSPFRRPDYLGRHFPELGYKPLRTDEIFSAEYHALEKERIFKKSWLRVGTVAQLPEPGDYLVRDIEACDTSVIVVRGRDRQIRAFHNVCSHRNNKVAYEACGKAPSFVCRFHSWVYDLEGRLVTVPEEEIFSNLDKAQHGLTPVACETWEGFIFINVDPEPAQTLREYLGEEIWNGFNGYFENFAYMGTIAADVNANWKLVLDAFVESYHFSTVHKATAGDIINTVENPNGFIADARFFGPHRIGSAMSNLAHEPTYCETLARRYSGNATLAPDVAMQKFLPPLVNPQRRQDWLSDILIIFPMCNLQILMGFFVTQNYWPISHDKTRWEFMLHMLPPQTAAQEAAVEYNRAFLRDVVREDVPNVEMIQQNLLSGAKNTQFIGDQEILVRHGHKVVADRVGHGYDA